MPCPQPDDPTPVKSYSPLQPSASKCVRCRATDATVHFRDASYCQDCAIGVFDQKVKAGLEMARGAGLAKYVDQVQSQVQTPSDNQQQHDIAANLALGFSGGLNSRALLQAVRKYFRPHHGDTGRNSKVANSSENGRNIGRTSEIGKIFVIFIDDSVIIPNGGQDRTEQARKLVESENCPELVFVPIKLQDVYSLDDTNPSTTVETNPAVEEITPVKDRAEALRHLFASIHPSDTPRTAVASARTRTEDLHRILIQYLLRREAKLRDCAALMLAESGTRMSIRLIESIAKGGGHKFSVEGAEAIWIDQLLVVRPLKPHLAQEVKFFAQVNQLQWLPDQDLVPSLIPPGSAFNSSGEPLMDKSSIARLTETFILNLERGVPSTVSTIGRTGDKLVLHSSSTTTPSSSSHQTGFQIIGPSVTLPPSRKERKRTPLLSSDTTLVNDEPRIGARAIRLAYIAKSLPHWSTRFGCCLCSMPFQSNARHWKKNITLFQQQQQSYEEEDGLKWICYACLLLFSSSTSTIFNHFPPFFQVHRNQYSLIDSEREKELEISNSLSSFSLTPPPPSLPTTTAVMRKINPQEMKSSISCFLIPQNE